MEVGFSTDYGKALPRIVGFSILFHLLVFVVVFGVASYQPRVVPKKIPVFDLIKLPPKGVHHVRPQVPKPVQPKPEEAKPEPKPQVKPPTPKIESTPKLEPKVETKPVEAPPEQATPDPAPKDNWDVDDIPEGTPEGIDDPDLPSLRAVGDLVMDPLMQDYLERLQNELMSRFIPPDGLTIPPTAKTTVQFTIQRSGRFTDINLKVSSGNATWDRLAMRAVQLARPMQLPGVYRGQVLPLVFDFKQKR